MSVRARFLTALGVVGAGVGLFTGGVEAAYGAGPEAFAVRAGVALVVIGVATGRLSRPSGAELAGVVVGVVLAVYAVGVAVMSLDALTGLGYGTPPAVGDVLGTQAASAPVVLPLAAGYAVGVVARRRTWAALALVPAIAVLAFVAMVALWGVVYPDRHGLGLLYDAAFVTASTLLASVPVAVVATGGDRSTDPGVPEAT